mgnify:CR=1 FL=1
MGVIIQRVVCCCLLITPLGGEHRKKKLYGVSTYHILQPVQRNENEDQSVFYLSISGYKDNYFGAGNSADPNLS